MDDEVVATSDDGRVRVRVVPFEGMDNPREDGDYHLAGVVTLYAGGYMDTPDPAGSDMVRYAALYWLNKYGWRRTHRLLERYVRILGGVSWYVSPQRGAVGLWYLLPADWVARTESPWNADKALAALRTEADEYRAWCDGETYGVVMERRVTWRRVEIAEPADTMETWEEIESSYGYIGYEWAEQEAREMLAAETGGN